MPGILHIFIHFILTVAFWGRVRVIIPSFQRRNWSSEVSSFHHYTAVWHQNPFSYPLVTTSLWLLPLQLKEDFPSLACLAGFPWSRKFPEVSWSEEQKWNVLIVDVWYYKAYKSSQSSIHLVTTNRVRLSNFYQCLVSKNISVFLEILCFLFFFLFPKSPFHP